MPNPRELSQIGSFVEVNDTNKNIGIATTGTPFVGIGTLSPDEKLHIVGNLRVDGNITGVSDITGGSLSGQFDRLVVGILTATTLDNPNLTVDTITVSTAATIGRLSVNNNLNVSGSISTLGSVLITSGIVTAVSSGGTVTYYGDGQYLDNVGLAVTYIDNDLLVDGTITADNLILYGGIGSLCAGLTINNLVLSGVGTIGGVQLGPSGIVTAGAGTTTVVYYGDGYNLTNIQASQLTGFKFAIRTRSTGRWTLGQNVVKVTIAHDDTFEVEARSGIVTVSIGNAAIPPLTVK